MKSATTDFDLSKMRKFVAEANVFMEQLRKESDRGAALVGVAFLDELLTRLFKSKMLLTDKLSKELFEGFGPLHSLAARIKVAYCLGWIGLETFRELNLLREIRNDFAHTHEPLTFTNKRMEARCRELKIQTALLPGRLAVARDKFLFSASMLALRLEYYRHEAQIPHVGWDPPVMRLDTEELEAGA